MELTGKTILVTGGAVRLGRRICERLAGEGARVVIHCRRSGTDARSLADAIRDAGGSAWVVQEDLDSEAGCEAVIREALALAGSLDALVNNASVFNKRSLAETDLSHFMQEFRPNLIAPLLLIRAFVRVSKEGRIVNLLDRRITALEKGALAYQLSKRSLADLTRLAAVELAPAFTVNGVAPGPVLPPREGGGISEKAGRVLTRHRPTPDEVADAVLFLLRADSVTGQVIFVDGGQHLSGQGG